MVFEDSMSLNALAPRPVFVHFGGLVQGWKFYTKSQSCAGPRGLRWIRRALRTPRPLPRPPLKLASTLSTTCQDSMGLIPFTWWTGYQHEGLKTDTKGKFSLVLGKFCIAIVIRQSACNACNFHFSLRQTYRPQGPSHQYRPSVPPLYSRQ